MLYKSSIYDNFNIQFTVLNKDYDNLSNARDFFDYASDSNRVNRVNIY